MLFVSQAIQVLIVSLTVGLFFVLFGLLAIERGSAPRVDRRSRGDPVIEFSLGGQDLPARPSELLRVAGGLAAFSGFYFAVAMLTDSTYREEFLEELTDEMRTSFKARADYLRLRAAR